jgi:photosystem II stability/assembly factor-like uncharacterized protein
MKQFVAILSILLIGFNYCYSQQVVRSVTGWFEQESGTSEILRACSFFNSNFGLIVGNNGIILRTTDGGNNWSMSSSNTAEDLYSVDVVSIFIASVVGNNGIILKTTDGGLTWFEQESIATSNLNSIFFIDENTGWICGDSGTLLRTANGGANWLSNNLDTLWNLNKIYFLDSNLGWIGGVRNFYRTTNGGQSWQIILGYINEINDFCFYDSLLGWAFFYDITGWSVVRRTTDGGFNWEFQFIAKWYSEDLFFMNESIGWAVGREFIYKTEDSGYTWDSLGFDPLHDFFTDIEFVDSLTGWTVGYGGKILKTITGGVTSIEEEEIIPSNFYLGQNYPNPFNSATKIKFTIPYVELGHTASLYTILKVYDVVGNKIATLVNEKKTAGEYEVDFNAKQLPSGIYLYQLQVGKFTQTKKMVLLR